MGPIFIGNEKMGSPTPYCITFFHIIERPELMPVVQLKVIATQQQSVQ